jgi:CRISPR-associated endonuclease Csn1
MNYVLGLDIGITSVGWATLELDLQDEPIRIIDLNSRIFDRAEVPKTGESLAAPRRMARSTRRRIRRRKFRVMRVKNYLIRNTILDKKAMMSLYDDLSNRKDIYELRYEGLKRKLGNEEWARILIYLAKHRGFKSNRKSMAADKDEGAMLSAVKENEELLKNYVTVGEMLYLDKKFQQYKRNKGGIYSFTVSRAMLLDEIKKLFEIQRTMGNPYATEALENEYIQIFTAQRNFDEGPGSNSPYSGNQIEKMIGECTFEAPQKRAPKASYAFMAFNLRQKINHIKIKENGSYRFLTVDEQNKVEQLAWKKESLNYSDLRKTLELPEETTFQDIRYKIDKTKDESEKKCKFSWVKEYHAIRKALNKENKDRILELNPEQIDVIGYAFTAYKNDVTIKAYMEKHGIEEKDILVLLENLQGFSKFGHLSIKACNNILPFLREGMIYSSACSAAGYDFRKGNQGNIDDIPNPVVKRAISQTLKVIKAVNAKYGCAPVEIHVELARDLARSYADRDKMRKGMEDNQEKNERIRQRLIKEFNVLQPTGQDIVKFKLYEQQQCECAYSQKQFDIEKLLHDSTYAEVDHIIPYSRCFDDSYKNKVLVFTKENRQKGNRTPFEYFENQPDRKQKFIVWTKKVIKDYRKRENLLREHYTTEEETSWKERNLTDTRYISKFVYNFLNNNFTFKPGNTGKKRHVIAVNGSVTSYVRKRLGIPKIREDGDLHHAVDAVIIAAITQGVVNRISRYSKIKELQYFQDENGNIIDTETGEILERDAYKNHRHEVFPEPWPQFRNELVARVSDNAGDAIKRLNLPTYNNVTEIRTPFVSRMPNRKVHGPAHLETVKGPKLKAEGYAVVKRELQALKLEMGEIKDYYNPSSDKLLYEALKKRLNEFGGDGKEAFKEPFYKPRTDGTHGPLVKKVKIMEKSSLNVEVYGGRGIAGNGSMVRVDVFAVEEKGKKHYFLVPIYVADTVKDELPNRAIVQHKNYSDWKIMNDNDFIFSLYPNDLIYVENHNGIKLNLVNKGSARLPREKIVKNSYLYYKKTGISTGAVCVINDDHTYEQPSLGVKMLDCFEKCVVDIDGTISHVSKEKRQGFKK